MTTRLNAARHFDLAEANRLVPMLNRVFGEIRAWLGRLRELSVKLESGGQVDVDEKREFDELVLEVRTEVEKLTELGIEVKSADGLVDFRALKEGRTVYLCWQFPETEITQWHELDAGFVGRQPIAAATDFKPTYLS